MTRTTAARLAGVALTIAAGLAAAASLGGVVRVSDRLQALRAATDTIPLVALKECPIIVRTPARGARERYGVHVDRGEHVRVAVTQMGVDVAVQIRDPAGTLLATIDDDVRPTGVERVDLVGLDGGTYAVEVVASSIPEHAGSYTINIDTREPATDADRLMDRARHLRAAAAAFESRGEFPDAQPLLERALTLTVGVHGLQSREAARLLVALAENALANRNDLRAETLVRQAIPILDRQLGGAFPDTARAQALLAVIEEHRGETLKAAEALRAALPALARMLGTDHRWYASALMTAGSLRYDAGDVPAAEAMDRQAMDVLERIGDTRSFPYVAILNNLGEIAHQKGDPSGAEALFRRALATDEALEGPDRYRATTSLQNLGELARERGDRALALEYETRALTIRERLLGGSHPDVAEIVGNLAVLFHNLGDDQAALAAHFRALGIRERALGPYHPATLNSVDNLARTYAAMGDRANAIAYERRADAIVEAQLALNFAAGSEREQLALARGMAGSTDRTLSLHLREARPDSAAASLAALVLLQRKGRVQDAMADAFVAVRQRLTDPADRLRLDRLTQVKTHLARLALTARGTASPEDARRASALEAERDRIERVLSAHSVEFRAQVRPVTVAAVQAVIPRNAALVEFAVFRPFDPRAERNDQAYGSAHYAAYVLRDGRPPVGVDLGPAAAIDAATDAFRAALRTPASTDVEARARTVYALVIEPVRAAFGDAGRLIVSPDGNLNLIPFEALLGPRGRYLIEDYTISYVSSGRDLLRMRIPRPAAARPVIIADPAFGEPESSVRLHRAAVSSSDVESLYFAPLSATGPEGRAIKALFPDAALLTGRSASKARLVGVRAPAILHIASHGFFLQDASARAGSMGDFSGSLLRSGVALAGANLTPRRADGILTALEASALNLWGTKLVTLSACDTGLGDVGIGEGVYGLRRAFVLAGAETLVMSLWPITDYVARDTMVAYYTGLRAGRGRADALRDAKLALLRVPNRRHPYFWAGFIQSGAWTGLNGAASDR